MITINQSNNNLVITNTDKFGFPFQDGQLTVPVNSLVYTLENQSDYIAFRSASNNDTLFAGSLGNLKIGDTLATRDNFVALFNAIAYAASGSGSVNQWFGTQAQYDELGTQAEYDNNTIYNILDEE
jgi:hypothetical protein